MNYWPQVLSPWMSIRLPGSGNVFMNYNPWTNWGWSDYEAGDPDIEHEIFTTVALPGKQLGRLTDAVLSLIELASEAHPELDQGESAHALAFREFKELADRILITKRKLQGSVEGDAENALLRLKYTNRDAFNRLIDKVVQARS